MRRPSERQRAGCYLCQKSGHSISMCGLVPSAPVTRGWHEQGQDTIPRAVSQKRNPKLRELGSFMIGSSPASSPLQKEAFLLSWERAWLHLYLPWYLQTTLKQQSRRRAVRVLLVKGAKTLGDSWESFPTGWCTCASSCLLACSETCFTSWDI